MALLQQFTNFASGNLQIAITNISTTMTLVAGDSVYFPTVTGSQYFYCVLKDNAGVLPPEIVKVTGTAGSVFTITRAQDNTSAANWAAGTEVLLRWVNASIQDFATEVEIAGLGYINVKNAPYNAVGNGIADDTAAFTAAIAALATEVGGTILVPPGKYKITSGLSWSDKPVTIMGSGAGVTTNSGSKLIFSAGVQGFTIQNGASSYGATSSLINLHIAGSDVAAGANDGVRLQAHGARMINCYVEGFAGHNVHILSGYPVPSVSINANSSLLQNVRSYNSFSDSFHVYGSDSNVCTFIDCDASDSDGWGFYENSLLGNTYIGCHESSSALGAWRFGDITRSNQLYGCYKETTGTTGLQFDLGGAAQNICYMSIMADAVVDNTASKANTIYANGTLQIGAPITAVNGTGSNVAYGFRSDPDTGFNWDSANRFAAIVGGSGHTYFQTDGFLLQRSYTGTLSFFIDQIANTATDNASVVCRVPSGSAGDPKTTYTIFAVATWEAGMDNSDSDAYVISNSTLGTSNALKLTQTQHIIPPGSAYAFGSSGTATPDLFFVRDAANVGALKNGTAAQALNIYGNTTGSKYLFLSHDGTNAVIDTSATAGLVSIAPTNATSVSIGKKISSYNGITSAGLGVPVVVAAGRSVGAIAAVASVSTFTVGAADATFEVSANVLVTTATTHSFNVTVGYTDEGNTARTLTLNFSTLAGVISNAAITNVAGAVPYEGVPMHIRAKAATAITIATTGTFTTVVYNVEGVIKQTA